MTDDELKQWARDILKDAIGFAIINDTPEVTDRYYKAALAWESICRTLNVWSPPNPYEPPAPVAEHVHIPIGEEYSGECAVCGNAITDIGEVAIRDGRTVHANCASRWVGIIKHR